MKHISAEKAVKIISFYRQRFFNKVASGITFSTIGSNTVIAQYDKPVLNKFDGIYFISPGFLEQYEQDSLEVQHDY